MTSMTSMTSITNEGTGTPSTPNTPSNACYKGGGLYYTCTDKTDVNCHRDKFSEGVSEHSEDLLTKVKIL